MKVPTLMSPRTRPVDNTEGYSQQRTSPAAFGAGIGNALQQFGGVLSQREEKTDRFSALTALSDFETQINRDFMEGQRESNPDGKGFAAAAEADYERRANEFLATVPQNLREEFKYRVGQMKQGVVSKALEFQYKAGDEFFRQGISKEYEKARNGLDPRLGGDPKQLEAYKTRMKETIDASDLLPQEKVQLWNRVQAGLEGVGYRAAVASHVSSAGGPSQAQAFDIIKGHEGEVLTAYPDKRASTGKFDAWRIGYGSDTITAPDGTWRRVQKGDVITKEDAVRDLNRRINEFQGIASKAVGVDTWNKLPGNVQAALTSVTYNYGRLPKSVEIAVRTGNIEEIAMRVEQLSANKDRRRQEAEVIRGKATPSSSVDADPAFANVPYEDRLALTKDAVSDATQEANERARQNKALYESQLNTLLTNIHDGTAGQVEIDAFRQTHPNMEYSDLTKADSALKTYNEGLGLAATGFAKLQSGGVFDPTDTDDKKRVNAMVGKDGLAALQSGDRTVVTNGIIPLVQQTGMIPSDVSGSLMGMMRSTNQQRAMFAYDTLSQLSDASPRAFDQLPESVQKAVAFWRARKDMMPADELMAALNGGTTAEQRQAQMTLEKEAKDYLGTSVNKVPNLTTLVSNLPGEFASWYQSNPAMPALPWAAQAVYQEYQTEFIDAYKKYGNPTDASTAATEAMKKRWGVTSVGQKSLIRNPPETVYKAYNGSYDWINDAVRRENNLSSDTKFQLISDDTTASEVELYRSGQLDRPPSYKIATYKDGVWREVPGRQWFQVDPETKLQDETNFRLDNELNNVKGRLSELAGTMIDAEQGFIQPDPDDVEEFNQLQTRYDELVKTRQTTKQTQEDEQAQRIERARAAGAKIGSMINANNR